MRKMSVEEAATRVDRSEITIRRQLGSGKLTPIVEYEGGQKRVYIAQSELEKLYPKAFGGSIGGTPREPQPCRVIAFANQKGGVGKTTSCANLAGALAADGTAVLAIDCDPQGNLTQALGPNPDNLDTTIYNALVDRVPLEKAIMTPVMGIETLSLVGANLDLASADTALQGVVARDSRLRQVITPYLDRYEYILLDCPPTLGLLTLNALVACTEVIIPVDMGVFSLRGVAKLLTTISDVRDVNHNLQRIRALINRTDKTNFSADVETELSRTFGSDLFKTVIRRSVRISEAQAVRVPITVHRPNDPTAVDYFALAQEVKHGA